VIFVSSWSSWDRNLKKGNFCFDVTGILTEVLMQLTFVIRVPASVWTRDPPMWQILCGFCYFFSNWNSNFKGS